MVPKHCDRDLTVAESWKLYIRALSELDPRFWTVKHGQNFVTGAPAVITTCSLVYAGDGTPQDLMDFCADHKVSIRVIVEDIDQISFVISRRYK